MATGQWATWAKCSGLSQAWRLAKDTYSRRNLRAKAIKAAILMCVVSELSVAIWEHIMWIWGWVLAPGFEEEPFYR